MIKLIPDDEGKIYVTLRRKDSVIERYGVGCVRRGEEDCQVHGGPMVPGPWAYVFRLCGVIDNHGGSGAESRDRLESGEEHYFDHGDLIEIDGVVYRTERAPNENTKLIKHVNLDDFIEQFRDAAIADCDEAMHDFVEPEEIEEFGDVYEAYCELGNGEAENQVAHDYAYRFLNRGGTGKKYDIVNDLHEAWFA